MTHKFIDIFSRWTLRLDGGFLVTVGSAALVADSLGHFFGLGPLAGTLGSPYTIGGFEAHGLAAILGAFMLRADLMERRSWHALGLIVHLLLGSANLMFWSSFLQLDLPTVGIVTTALHIAFVSAQAVCLSRLKPGAAVAKFGNPAATKGRCETSLVPLSTAHTWRLRAHRRTSELTKGAPQWRDTEVMPQGHLAFRRQRLATRKTH